MTNVIPMQQNIDYADMMTSGEMAKFLRKSRPTVLALAKRKVHPLPSIDTGAGSKRQLIFLRSSVLRWLREEEKLAKPVRAEGSKERQKAG